MTNNELKKYGYNFFVNLEDVSEIIHNATLMNDGETLRNYLKSIFNELEWRNKLIFAQQVANAIEHFHSRYHSWRYEGKFSRTKASDVYSVGILLENPIKGTPRNYFKIYQDCWNQDPDLRPNIKKVIQDLEHVAKIIVESIEKSSLIGQFTSLKELYIKDCYGFNRSDCLSLAPSFTQLSSFHCVHSSDGHLQEFIRKILETVNTNLRNIRLNLHPHPKITFDTFSSILNYCTKIEKLTLHFLSPKQSDFVKEGEIKKIIVKRARLFTLSDEHLKVMEEYGVQFDMEQYFK
ncbi:hypothetical protein Glove_692g23 [Diversispora epigaea]|uniref:Serine-threonine/tyrosine-protein kinase catalytic domain-containing protein n=1 Tax=Diversispora epigaea TaxID=1348612 RepID=A0A397GAG0_9GLOM|nr:hypothetical protein Glove_692g23 [Diversispora epigaea]